MCNRHEILEFIEARLDDSFSSGIFWLSVKDHHYGNPWQLLAEEYEFKCTECQSRVYPCPSLVDAAGYWKDHEDFDPDWTSGSREGNLDA